MSSLLIRPETEAAIPLWGKFWFVGRMLAIFCCVYLYVVFTFNHQNLRKVSAYRNLRL